MFRHFVVSFAEFFNASALNPPYPGAKAWSKPKQEGVWINCAAPSMKRCLQVHFGCACPKIVMTKA